MFDMFEVARGVFYRAVVGPKRCNGSSTYYRIANESVVSICKAMFNNKETVTWQTR